jgi:tetratricopeptide (TPR) repeat protein
MNTQRALKLDSSNAEVLRAAAIVAQVLGRLDIANALQGYVAICDPVNPISHFNLGFFYRCASRPEVAIESYRSALRLAPDYISAHCFICCVLLMQGAVVEAKVEIELEPAEVYRLIGLSMVCHTLGERMAADAALAQLIEKYSEDMAFNIAYVFAYRNEADLAFEWLQKAIDYQDPGLRDIVTEPMFSNILMDPRWSAIIKEIGMSPDQLETIAFELSMPNLLS